MEDRGEAGHQVGLGVWGHKVAEAGHSEGGLLHRRREVRPMTSRDSERHAIIRLSVVLFTIGHCIEPFGFLPRCVFV